MEEHIAPRMFTAMESITASNWSNGNRLVVLYRKVQVVDASARLAFDGISERETTVVMPSGILVRKLLGVLESTNKEAFPNSGH